MSERKRPIEFAVHMKQTCICGQVHEQVMTMATLDVNLSSRRSPYYPDSFYEIMPHRLDIGMKGDIRKMELNGMGVKDGVLFCLKCGIMLGSIWQGLGMEEREQ